MAAIPGWMRLSGRPPQRSGARSAPNADWRIRQPSASGRLPSCAPCHGVAWRNRRAAVSHLRFILAAARVAAAMALVVLVIKIAPTLADHAADHSGTYASTATAASAHPARGATQ